MHIWTAEEIKKLPRFGARHGWFYGLCRIEGKLFLGEIFPGIGAAEQVTDGLRERQWAHVWEDLKILLGKPHWVIRDLLFYKPHKRD